MVQRYRGTSGQVDWIEEKPPEAVPVPVPPPVMPPPPPLAQSGPPPQMRRQSGLPSLLSGLESGDVLMLLVLYLLYRESGDTELLVMIAALLFA